MINYPIITREGKGSSLTYTEADGNLRELDIRTADGWVDNIIEMTVRAGPTEPVMGTFKGNISLLSFPDNTMTEVFGNFHINHDYKPGSALYPHIHWATSTNSTGVVRWGIEYTIAKGHQQEAFSDPVIVYVEQTVTGVPYMHYVGEVSDADAIPGIGIEPDTLILMRVFRDTDHPNDTYHYPVFGICLDLHYQADRSTTPNKRPNFYT